MARPPLLLVLGLAACAARRPPVAGIPQLDGPRQDELPLWRLGADADKIFIEATLKDGVPRLFLVDTGASLSALSQEVADELALTPTARDGLLVGVGGSTPWREAEVPALHIGRFTVSPQRFAVGVAGVPDSVGPIPIAGIIGNDVWSQFTLVVDYPAGTLTLARPDVLPPPAHPTPLFFNGSHAGVPITLLADGPAGPKELSTYLEVDTGARGLVLSGLTHQPLSPYATEGLEIMLGVGAGDELPLANFLQRTRRVKVSGARLGGAEVSGPLTARWINYTPGASAVGPAQMTGLVGFEVLQGHRVTLDYPGRRFALEPSAGPPALHDLHDWGLAQTKGANTPQAVHRRVELLADLDRNDEAAELLDRWRKAHPEDTDAAIMAIRLARHRGDTDAALALALALPIGDLVDQGEAVSTANALWLAGRAAEGRRLAEAAVAARPEAGEAWVALADARRIAGDLPGARAALQTANRKDENPDGHLLRRAWIAADEGDTFGSITHLRRLLEVYPNGGVAPWLYALTVHGSPEAPLFQADMAQAEARLHPEDLPFDFLSAAFRVMGDPARSSQLRAAGEARDCAKAPSPESAANCAAWYRALAREDLPAAAAKIDEAIAADPHRSEFRDTQAVVLEAQGQLPAAREAAWAAARLEPDDVYLLWQAARLDRLAHPPSPAAAKVH